MNKLKLSLLSIKSIKALDEKTLLFKNFWGERRILKGKATPQKINKLFSQKHFNL